LLGNRLYTTNVMTEAEKKELEELEDEGYWGCNCFNFPFQKCDQCKILFYDYEKRKSYLQNLREKEGN